MIPFKVFPVVEWSRWRLPMVVVWRIMFWNAVHKTTDLSLNRNKLLYSQYLDLFKLFGVNISVSVKIKHSECDFKLTPALIYIFLVLLNHKDSYWKRILITLRWIKLSTWKHSRRKRPVRIFQVCKISNLQEDFGKGFSHSLFQDRTFESDLIQGHLVVLRLWKIERFIIHFGILKIFFFNKSICFYLELKISKSLLVSCKSEKKLFEVITSLTNEST